MESQPKTSTTSDALCKLHKCGAGLKKFYKKKGKLQRAIREQKYVSFEKDQLLEKQNDEKKKCKNQKL